jgi:hypothetical protein
MNEREMELGRFQKGDGSATSHHSHDIIEVKFGNNVV